MRHREKKAGVNSGNLFGLHVVSLPCRFDSEWGRLFLKVKICRGFLQPPHLQCSYSSSAATRAQRLLSIVLLAVSLNLLPRFALTVCITSSFLRCSLSQFLSFRLKDIALEISSVNVRFLTT